MNKPFLRVVLSITIISLLLVFSSCQIDKNAAVNEPSNPQISSFTKLSVEDPAVQSVMAVQNRHTPDLMKNSNIVGTATTLTEDGRLAVVVYLKEDEKALKGRKTISAIPSQLEGVPVLTEVTGEFKAMGTTAVSHTAKQTPPIQLGTSGGWRYDLANGYCCGGTLGSLVKIGTAQYIMSNYHVFESDIVSGGNGRVASNGDPVIQPGLIDVGCNAASAQNVGTLNVKKSLPNSNVDVGIAQVITGMVNTTGSILEIGTISATTIAPAIKQGVKKSGRTSGLTRSTISGLNATISVQYENECAGGVAFTKTFTGQIVIANRGSKFLRAGDSGSLMVQDVTTNPKAVGLLFAGSSTTAIANPIGQVLSFLGATMVGN